MKVRRLGWAGIEIQADGESAVIDLLLNTSRLRALRSDREPFPPPERLGSARAAMVTHLHADHADPAAIHEALAPDGVVLRPEPVHGTEQEDIWTARAEKEFAESGLKTQVVREWQQVESGPFHIVAVPAVDGLGDPQRNWVISAGNKRIFHGGDTMFHGFWWRIAHRYGPFDAALLPIDGVRVNFEPFQPPSPFPAALDPQQAAVAAHILKARKIIPIHFGSCHKPPVFVEVDRPVDGLMKSAAELGLEAQILVPGDSIAL